MKSKLLKQTLTSLASCAAVLTWASCETPGTSTSGPADEAVGKCMGVNSCKGQGDCGGKTHECAGKNSCAKMGWKKMSKKDCDAQGGSFET